MHTGGEFAKGKVTGSDFVVFEALYELDNKSLEPNRGCTRINFFRTMDMKIELCVSLSRINTRTGVEFH